MPPQYLPPPQPTYILRGHSAQIHALKFLRQNTRLLTGDADGWIVLWDLVTRRAAAVWRAHASVVLGLGLWIGEEDRIISHGRDGFLRVWQIRPEDEKDSSKVLPVDSKTDVPEEGRYPWLLHSLRIQTVNFCGFDQCLDLPLRDLNPSSSDKIPPTRVSSILIGATAQKDDEVVIYKLPSEQPHSTVPAPRGVSNVGMTMGIRLVNRPEARGLSCVTGYESGLTAVHVHSEDEGAWKAVYLSRPHTQPILSLDVSLRDGTKEGGERVYFTSGADAVIAAHTLPAGIFPIIEGGDGEEGAEPLSTTHESDPIRITKTGHSGQQGLTVRGDGKIFATAGWDGRLRVYSVKSMRELAVLKWHKEGCYAVAFAEIFDEMPEEPAKESQAEESEIEEIIDEGRESNDGSIHVLSSVLSSKRVAGRGLGLVGKVQTVQQQRDHKVRYTHWLAAGSKDGKVSLWDVY